MKTYDARGIAAVARAVRADRPATAVVHDSPHVRLVVFRLEAGQQVPTHTSTSTVVLSVLEGTGMLTGVDGERAAGLGDVVAFEPGEPHGMRSIDGRFILLATISPRPGER